jgi:membrane protein required for colicin V production
MHVNWPDYALIAIITLSILIGVWRGFVKEAFSLAVWVAAFVIAFQFSGAVAGLMENSISLPSARTALAFGGLFVVTLLVGGLLTFLVGKMVEKTGLSGTDRLLGGVFGIGRGLILVLMLIIVAGLTPIPRDPWWQESETIQALVPLAEWMAELLPDSIREHIDLYPQAAEEIEV